MYISCGSTPYRHEEEPSTVDNTKLNIQTDQPKPLEDDQGDNKKTDTQLVKEEKAESGNV